MAETLERGVFSHPVPPLEYALLRKIQWQTYEALLADHQGSAWPRFVFDSGVLEIMTPSSPHDRVAYCVQTFINLVAQEWRMDRLNLAHTTMRRRDIGKGFEADASIYLKHAPEMRPKSNVDLDRDPPPDLVLEVEVTRSALDKLAIYARFGVPEVWRCDTQNVTFHVLTGDNYLESSTSIALAGVSTHAVLEFIQSSWKLDAVEWEESVREWARKHRPRLK